MIGGMPWGLEQIIGGLLAGCCKLGGFFDVLTDSVGKQAEENENGRDNGANFRSHRLPPVP